MIISIASVTLMQIITGALITGVWSEDKGEFTISMTQIRLPRFTESCEYTIIPTDPVAIDIIVPTSKTTRIILHGIIKLVDGKLYLALTTSGDSKTIMKPARFENNENTRLFVLTRKN